MSLSDPKTSVHSSKGRLTIGAIGILRILEGTGLARSPAGICQLRVHNACSLVVKAAKRPSTDPVIVRTCAIVRMAVIHSSAP